MVVKSSTDAHDDHDDHDDHDHSGATTIIAGASLTLMAVALL